MKSEILRLSRPTRKTLEEECILPSRPAILTDLPDWYPATSQPLSLLDGEKHRIVDVSYSEDSELRAYTSGKKKVRQVKVELGEFLEEIHRPNSKLAGAQMGITTHAWLLQYLQLSKLEGFIDFDNQLSIDFWMQSPGARTHLHFDPIDNINLLLQGQKHWVLFDPDQLPSLYPGRGLGYERNFSSVDVFRVDHQEFPLFAGAERLEFEIRAGEGLFLPAYWWHYVVTDEVSCAMTFLSLDRPLSGQVPWYWSWYKDAFQI